jgi:hypothetical protein
MIPQNSISPSVLCGILRIQSPPAWNLVSHSNSLRNKVIQRKRIQFLITIEIASPPHSAKFAQNPPGEINLTLTPSSNASQATKETNGGRGTSCSQQ